MKRVDEIMREMGFKAGSSSSVQAAFIRNLIKQAYGVDVPVPASLIQKDIEETKSLSSPTKVEAKASVAASPAEPAQLSFAIAIGE